MSSKDTPEKKESEKIDPALLEKALDDFKGLAKGNGLKPENLTLKKFHGEIFNFNAYKVFKIEAIISEQHIPGREHGEPAGSRTDAQQKIQQMVEKITRDKDVKKLTINLLKKRKDLGFATNNQIIKLDRLNKKFVIHEGCVPCDTSGKIMCRNCHGKQQITCITCNGQRDIQCHTCNGSQFTDTPQGRQQCHHCHGHGRIGCDMCRQTGEMSCPKCRSTGRMPCQNCSSSGWNSHLFHVGIRATGNFNFDRENLPEDLLTQIDKYGPLLGIKNHAEIRIVEDKNKDTEMDQKRAIDEYIIPYQARLPWGDIIFSIKGKNLKGNLFGFNPLIVNIPPVIEKIIGKSLHLLNNAAQGQGNIAKNISNAIRARAIGEAFLATIPNSRKKADAIMKARYPYGISSETLEKMTASTNKAMKNLTKKPRMTGLSIGALIISIFYTAYFIGPLRGTIIATTSASFPDIVPDVGTIIISGVIITSIMQMNAGKALKQALGRILNKSNKSKIMPKPLKSAIWGCSAALILFCAFLGLAIMTGTTLPKWL